MEYTKPIFESDDYETRYFHELTKLDFICYTVKKAMTFIQHSMLKNLHLPLLEISILINHKGIILYSEL